MPRIARGGLGQGWFHVLNRGNHRQRLFTKPEDFALFLGLLAEAGERYEVKLWGYCLMGNHWHLVVETPHTKELSQWMHWISNRHVRIFHQRNRRLGGGHIYQGRYKSFPIQNEEYLYTVLRYVEANPLRAKLVEEAQEWPWSSLSTVEQVEGVAKWSRPQLEPWTRGKHWMTEVNRALPESELTAIRQSALRGAPFGDKTWVEALATKFGLESTLRPRGRPRKVEPQP